MPVCLKCQSPVNKNGQCNLCLLQVGLANSHGNQSLNHHLDSKGLPTIEEISASFPQLTIQRLIGRGGMGAIYLARQTALDRKVAVKLISKEISNDATFIERFEREARALAKLNHPHVVTVFDSGRTADGTAYLIMEFIEGINLREAIQSMPISVEDAVDYISKMAMALQYAHEKGIVHRDIKPENVLLGEDGSLKIVDFGIAKILAGANSPIDNLTRTRQVLGTPHYLAPEHLEAHDQVDHRVDLYSLGVLFYELLTRKLPMGNFEQPSTINSNVSTAIDRIVSKCMQRNPSLRYQTASELNEDLKALATPVIEPILVASHSNRGISVPFECDALGGLAAARGVIRATDRGLRIEYKLTDEFLGTFKSQLQVLDIPRENLIRIDLKGGWFSHSLSVVVDSIQLIDTFPNSESGRIEVTIKHEDRLLVEQLISTMNLEPKIDSVATNVASTSRAPLNPLWAWLSLSKNTSGNPNAIPSQKPSGGATTLMWLQERRVANVFSVLETVGASLAVLCFAIYFFGLFPTRIEFRLLIAKDMNQQAKVEMQQASRDAIRARLVGLETVTDSKSDSMPGIRAWAFQSKAIMSRLQLTRAPKLHILVPADWSAPDSVSSYTLPIAKDLREAEKAVEKAPLGKVARCIAVPDGLASDRVRRITTQHVKASRSLTNRPHLLVIEWSQQGRKDLEEALIKNTAESKPKFGIEIDGILIAVSELQWLDGSSSTFELSSASQLDVDSIIAAVRGPDIPCDLECLNR
jgi:serine/threonine protein kinase